MPQSIFITGADGFIGKALTPRSVAWAGYACKVLKRKGSPTSYTSKEARPEQVVGDLLEPKTYRAALAGSDTVVHLAAVTGRAAPEEFERVNVEGTRALLRACKAEGVRRFLHMSTIAARYPDQRHYPYAKTKARAEALVRESGLDFAILRPTLVLGEMSPIWITLRKIAKLAVVPLPEGAHSVLVQPIHVNDVVRGIELVLESGRLEGEIFELGGPRPLPLRELLQLTQKALRGQAGRLLRVPLEPIRALLAAIEPAVRPLMPVTAGQLAVFANDSVPSENWLLAQLLPGMQSTEETIADLVEVRNRGAVEGKGS